jgi:hypothetical protein
MTNLNVTPNTITTSSPSSESKLEEKLSDWIFKLESGNNGYFAISATNGKIYHIEHQKAIELLALDLLIDNGNGFERILSFHKESAPSVTTSLSIIIKKEKKLIGNLNGKIFGFGFKDSAFSDVKSLFLHYQISSMHSFIAATAKSESIDIFYALISDRNNDPIADCFNGLLTALQRKESN